jgi:uncharacterized membrane protein YdjX (TVP38/TMEM64 family)
MMEMAQSIAKSGKKRGIGRWLPIIAIILGAVLFFALGLQRYLSLDALKANRDWLYWQVADRLILVLAVYVLVYAGVVALSLPGATVLTLAGGCMFGLWLATGVTVVAATLGATVLFLAARTAFGDLLRQRAGPWLTRLHDGFQANAFSYLLFLRLVPAFPFFVVNLVPAFLGVRLRTFILATFIGIVPGTFVYSSVGAGLRTLLDSNGEFSLGGVLTPQILTALIGLALLSLLPVAYKAWRKSQGTSQGTSGK